MIERLLDHRRKGGVKAEVVAAEIVERSQGAELITILSDETANIGMES